MCLTESCTEDFQSPSTNSNEAAIAVRGLGGNWIGQGEGEMDGGFGGTVAVVAPLFSVHDTLSSKCGGPCSVCMRVTWDTFKWFCGVRITEVGP